MASQKKKETKNPKGLPTQKKMSRKTKRIIVIISVIVMACVLIGGTLLVLFHNGIIGNSEYYKKLAADRKTVATCNGFEIPYEELRFVAQLYKDELEYTYGEGIWDDPATAEQHREELEALVMENLNQNYLVLSACQQVTIDINHKEKDAYVDKKMKELLKDDFHNDKKAMEKWFAETGMTEHYMRFCIGVQYLESTLYYTLLDLGIYGFDTSNIDKFMDFVAENNEGYARTIHVFVRNDKGDDIEANRQKAENMYNFLIAEPTATAREELMHEYIGSANNEDFNMVSFDGYYFSRSEMDPDYENAAFALAIGEVSPVVETTDGFYIIMRLQPEMPYIMLNAQTLLSYYQSARMGEYIKTFDEKCTVVFNEYGKSLDLLNLE